MRAIGVTTYGGPEALTAVELPDPVAGPGEVLIRVEAAGVAPIDAILRTGGLAPLYAGLEPPFVPGMDVAGTVVSLGDGVEPDDEVAVGQQVTAFVDFHGASGGYADLMVVPASSAVRAPAGLSAVQAVAPVMNALTARNGLDALASHGLGAGATVLVTGAAGNVGAYAVTLAHQAGMRVLALAGADDAAAVRGFGADVVLARTDDDAALLAAVHEAAPDGVDAVLDFANLQTRVLPALKDGGWEVVFLPWTGEAGTDEVEPGSHVTRLGERGLAVHHCNVRERATDREAMAALRDGVENGELAVRVDTVLPAAQASRAHELLGEHGRRGRIVLSFPVQS